MVKRKTRKRRRIRRKRKHNKSSRKRKRKTVRKYRKRGLKAKGSKFHLSPKVIHTPSPEITMVQNIIRQHDIPIGAAVVLVAEQNPFLNRGIITSHNENGTYDVEMQYPNDEGVLEDITRAELIYSPDH